MTAVAHQGDHTRKNGAIQSNKELSSQQEFSWVHRLAIPTFVIDDDHSHRVISWNEKMEGITGIMAPLIQSQPFGSILDECSKQRLTAAVQATIERGEESICHVSISESGAQVCLNLSTYRNSQDKRVHIVCFGQEQRAMNLDAPENSLMNRFPMVTVGYQGEIATWNASLECLTGHRKNEMIGRCFFDLIPKQGHQNALRCALTPVTIPSTSKSCIVDVWLKNGDLKTVLINISVDTTQSTDTKTVYGMILSDASDLGERDTHEKTPSMSALHLDRPNADNQELNQFISSSNVAIFGIDTTGKINEWNAQTVETTGLASAETMNKVLVSNFIAPSAQLATQEVLQTALRGRGTSNFEFEIRCRDGETRYLLASVNPRRDAKNNIVGVVVLAQDITESFKHDRAVVSMANELRKLIDTANAPIFGIDKDGDVNEWNDKTAEITGYTKEEAFDCSLVDTFIVPSMKDSVQEVLDNALEGRGTSNFELEFRTKSDEIRHLLVNATTRRDAENNVVGVLGVAQDVTEAVQRDRAVAGMALELRQLIDTANAPIFGIDIDGNVNEWNRRTSEITGYSKEEAFDEPLVETFIAESMQEKVREILDSALAGNETSNYELEFISKSGEPIFLLVNATTRRDPENAVVGVVGVAQDVTEDRKHAQVLQEMQYIRASQEAKVETERNMTAYFAHELRNPLGAIDSALNAMPDNLPDEAKSLISGMQLCSGFMSSIMNNLLDVRKMEEGKMTLSRSPISLKKILYNVHKMLLPSVRPGVRFEKICDTKGKDWVLGDAHRIQQVMTNVVTNAIKYTVTGSITLVMGWEGDKVKFECIDTGPGIPKNEQEKLFQRFVQRGGAPGTGLGLAIAKHLVDLTGGSIRFESDPTVRAGTNCVVLMELSLCDAPETVVEESTALIEEPISFMIIDDIKMNRMMLKRRILKGIAPNATITEAATGEEALEICGKEKFDVIVVDQYMEEAGGVMVGTDVVFAMRRMRIDSIVIGCSGNDMGTQFFEAGADWVWQKPMPSNSKIIQDIRTSLNERATRRRHAVHSQTLAEKESQ